MKTILLYPKDDSKKVKPKFFPLLEWYRESLSNNIWPSDWKKLQGFEPHDVGEYRTNEKVRILYAIKIHEGNKYVVVLSVDEKHEHYIPKKTIAFNIDKQISDYIKSLPDIHVDTSDEDKDGSYSDEREEEKSIEDSRKGLKGIRTLFEEPVIQNFIPKPLHQTIIQEDAIHPKKISLDLLMIKKKISKFEKAKNKLEDKILALNPLLQKLVMEDYKNEDFNQLFMLSAALPGLLPLLKVMVEYINPFNIDIFSKNSKGKMAIELAKDSTAKDLLIPLYSPAEKAIQRLKDCQTSAAYVNSEFYYTECQNAIKNIFSLPSDAIAHALTTPIFNEQNVLIMILLIPYKDKLNDESRSNLLNNIALLNGELQNRIFSYRMAPDFHNLFQTIIRTYNTPLKSLVHGNIIHEQPLLDKLQMIVESILNSHIRESCKSQIILSLINNKFKIKDRWGETCEIDTLEYLEGCNKFPGELAYLKDLKNQHSKLLTTTLLTEYSFLKNHLKGSKEELISCFIAPSFGKSR